ncbi:TPA: hypothetical protein ACL4Z6_001427 [Streptococcus pneumoniae]
MFLCQKDFNNADASYFSKFVTGGSSFSWEVFLIFIIDWVLLIVFAIQISYIFWRLSQKWKELSNK